MQITGHADGSVLMWDPTGDTLKPMLLIGQEKGPNKKAVVSVAVLEELGLLACGHANGKVTGFDIITSYTCGSLTPASAAGCISLCCYS